MEKTERHANLCALGWPVPCHYYADLASISGIAAVHCSPLVVRVLQGFYPDVPNCRDWQDLPRKVDCSLAETPSEMDQCEGAQPGSRQALCNQLTWQFKQCVSAIRRNLANVLAGVSDPYMRRSIERNAGPEWYCGQDFQNLWDAGCEVPAIGSPSNWD